jgi:uncharacterized membrane protein YdjX (TVP38/TMEM64 family)
MAVDRPAKKVALLVVGALGLMMVGGVFLPIGHRSFARDTLVANVRASGPLGPLALIALLVIQAVVAPLPSPPLLMAAGFVYGPLVGFVIGWVGLLLGAGACFGLARSLGRPFVERFVRAQRLAAIDQYVGSQSGTAFLTVLSLRVFMPPLFDAVSYGSGLVRLPFRWFILATALGEVPKVASFTYLGTVAGDAPTWLKAWIILIPMLGLLGLRLARCALRDRRPPLSTAKPDRRAVVGAGPDG